MTYYINYPDGRYDHAFVWINNTGRDITLSYSVDNRDYYSYAFIHCYEPSERCSSNNQIDDEIIGEIQTGSFTVPAGYQVTLGTYGIKNFYGAVFTEI